MKIKNINVLFVGSGNIVYRHIQNIKKFINPKILILKRSNSKINEKLKRFNFVKKISDGIKFKPDIIFICSPSSKHISDFKILRKYCNFFFIEKPISNKIIKNSFFMKDNKKYIQIGYMMNFLEVFDHLRKIIKSKKFGKLNYVNCYVGQFLKNWRKNKNYSKTVSANKFLGGGPLLELSHEINYCLNLFGYPKEVFCKMYKVSKLKINVDDVAKINLIYKNFFIDVTLDFLNVHKSRYCEFIFEKKTVLVDFIKGNIVYKSENKIYSKKIKINIKQSYSEEIKFLIKNFLKNNIGNKKNKIFFKNSLLTLKLIYFLELSTSKRKLIKL